MIKGTDFSKNLTLNELGLSKEESNLYSPSPDDDIRRILEALDIKSDDAILDFGAGKGAAMAIMVKFPFSFVGGVEISSLLCNIAEKNLEKLNLKNAGIFCSNASTFTDIDRYTYFYFFNPFPGPVLSQVIQNITESHRRNPRKISLVYYNPAYRSFIDESPLFKEKRKIESWYYETILYESVN